MNGMLYYIIHNVGPLVVYDNISNIYIFINSYKIHINNYIH